MRILVVAPYLPSPTRVRSLRVLEGLAALGHKITLVALASDRPGRDDSGARSHVRSLCENVYLVPHSRVESYLSTALHLASRTPLSIAPYLSRHMIGVLTGLAQEKRFDVAHIEHVRAGQAAAVLRDRMPVILDTPECMTDQYRKRMPSAEGSLERIVTQSELERLRRYEPQVAALHDRVVVPTEATAEALAGLSKDANVKLRIDIIPNGVDLDYFHPSAGTPILPGNIVFTGRLGSAIDRDAVRYFVHEIFPGIRNAYPLATVTFVGSDPDPELVHLAGSPGSGIEVVGRVADARPYLARAAVAVCPLRIPGGSRHRVLQIMAMGKAVVATAAACEAVDPNPAGQNLCLADTPLSFATQIIHLFNHPEEAERLGQNARLYVEERHDWRVLVRRLVGVYESALDARHSRAAA